MKTIIYISAFTILLGVLGCSKKLDLKPLDSASAAGFFASSDNFDLALSGLYDYMQGHGQGGVGGVFAGSHYWDVASDGFYFQFSWHEPYYDISNGNLSPTTSNVNFLWDVSYQAIGWANQIIIAAPTSNLSSDYQKEVDGEARFLRAITYLRLVSTYGDVPLILKNLKLSEVQVPRTTKDSVFAQIFLDLDQAAAELPISPYNGQMGRATKQAAMGMKVRALTYFASPLFNTSDDATRWSAARTAAQSLIQLAAANTDKIGLLSSYDNVFSLSNQDNKEIMFNIEYTANNSQEGGNDLLPFGPGKMSSQGGVAGGWGASAIVPEYADSYLMKDGLSASVSPLYNASNPFANRETRFYSTFYVANITVLPDGTLFLPQYLNSFGGSTFRAAYPLSIKKYIDPSAKNQAYDNEQAPHDIILRYADVILMFAEAENEVSGPDAAAYAAINQIRTRAGLPNITTGLSKDNFRTAIQNERKWELGYEGERYFDLRRWKIADAVLNNLPKGATFNIAPAKQFYPAKNYWWPIAQSTIDASPVLKQNTGY